MLFPCSHTPIFTFPYLDVPLVLLLLQWGIPGISDQSAVAHELVVSFVLRASSPW